MIVKWWRAYTAWCDRMGLTPENQRCCAPKLSDPELGGPELSEPELSEPEHRDSKLSTSFQKALQPQQGAQAPKVKADDASR
ncbi:hypothetical protein L1D29_04175 [Shewanella insulae]|uniref:hypothetical protein n=1 Tax=Shewanella insulae TaxID=2681496 RepID=UPI001EFD4B7B|nr:hypothetical protein [Shewanella insulae]MCG9712010.1 hypothetical protein [Shewanella insulae]